jgi:hypothetical protein
VTLRTVRHADKTNRQVGLDEFAQVRVLHPLRSRGPGRLIVRTHGPDCRRLLPFNGSNARRRPLRKQIPKDEYTCDNWPHRAGCRQGRRSWTGCRGSCCGSRRLSTESLEAEADPSRRD